MRRRSDCQGAGIGQGCHNGTVVVLAYGKDGAGNACFLKAAANAVGQLFRGRPHGVIDYDGLFAGILLGHSAVHVDNFTAHVSAPDKAVVRGNHGNVEGLDYRQGLENLGRIGKDNIEVVFLDPVEEIALVMLVRIAPGRGNVLAEGVLGEQDFGFRAVGDHAVGPVQHPCFLEDQGMAANGNAVAAFDSLDRPGLHLLAKVAGHGF